MLTHKMLDFPDEARTKCDSITDASIDLFKVRERLYALIGSSNICVSDQHTNQWTDKTSYRGALALTIGAWHGLLFITGCLRLLPPNAG